MIGLLLGVACDSPATGPAKDTGGPVTESPDTDTDTDTDTDIDTDADADADTDSDSDSDSDTDTDTDTDADTDPCTATIPADAVVIDDDTSAVDDAFSYWVCDHATLSAGGDTSRYYLGDRGELALTGLDGTVWAPAGSRVRMLDGTATVYMEEGASVEADPEEATLIVCPTITFVLDAAPSPGC